VVDAGPPARLLVYALDGTYDGARTDAWNASLAAVLGAAASLGGVAAGGGMLYVGEDVTGGVLAFDLTGTFHGRSSGYAQRVAGLAVDGQGRLLVHPGSGQTVRLSADGVAPSGSFRLGPIRIADPVAPEPVWQRLLAGADVPDGAQVQLFTYTTESAADPPALPAVWADPGDRLTPLNAWRPAPPNALDLLVLNEPGAVLWIGGRLVAGSGGSPAISRLHVEHDRDGWLPLLPAIYARDEAGRTFLTRLLALAESALEDEGALLDDLPRSFGAASAPDTDGERWLDWLSGWLAFPLDQRWDETTRRGAVARAFELNGRRGTAAGLRDLISLSLGLDVRVSEPGDRVGLWRLDGETASLGFTTQLAGAEAQGAVLGTTAILDASDLIDEDEAGTPLFEDLASRFCVHVYAADLTGPDSVDGLRRLVAREQPAESDAHVCVIEPRGRVGFQSTVGVDAIVAAGPGPLVLGDAAGGLGIDSALPPRPAGEPARLGLGARVGIDARLT
ncbi:MAG TPA: phage tail protein, partial [Gaiellaceae bacterium]